MSRRILIAVLLVAGLAVLVFGLPLGVAVAHLYRDEEVISLERRATLAGLAVPSSFAAHPAPVHLVPMKAPRELALYDQAGARVQGQGPVVADETVKRALGGRVMDSRRDNTIIVAVPLSSNEQVYGAVRASTPEQVVEGRIHRAWAAMAALAVGALLASGLLALYEAHRLARPVTRLADAAHRLGQGEFDVETPRSGTPEIDEVGAALTAASRRIGRLLERERRFSADASHQLRTPITALRLNLEAASLEGRDLDGHRTIEEALVQIDRLDATIDDLLRLAREEPVPSARLDLERLLPEVSERWEPVFTASGRLLHIDVERSLPAARFSHAATRQVLDVLLDNASKHGRGTVELTARSGGTGVIIEVTDEGPGIDDPANRVFDRGVGSAGGHGIGLALARSLAEAEGGRLLLAATGPGATFALVLPAVESPEDL